MKSTFDFHSRLGHSGEILTRPAHFLPGLGDTEAAEPITFALKMTHLPIFQGFYRFRAENLTMAQPLLRGELR